jgi:hypothetical protein
MLACAPVTSSHVHPSPIFQSRAGAYLSENPYVESVESFITLSPGACIITLITAVIVAVM